MKLHFLSFKLWVRDASSSLGVSSKTFSSAVVVVMLTVALAVLGVSVNVARNGGGQPASTAAVEPLIHSIGHSALLSGILIGVVFSMLSASEKVTMETALWLAGARRRDRLSILILPTVAVSLFVTLLMVIFLTIITASVVDLLGNLLSLFSIVFLAILGNLFSLSLHAILVREIRYWLRLPFTYANGVSGVFLMVSGMLVCRRIFSFGSSVSSDTSFPFVPDIPLLFFKGQTAKAALVLALFAAVVLGVLWETASDRRTKVGSTLLAISPFPLRKGSKSHRAVFWYETASLLREPYTIMTFFILLATTVLVCVYRSNALLVSLGLSVLPWSSSSVVLRAVGHNMRPAWVIWHPYGKSKEWIFQKICSGLIVSYSAFLATRLVIALFVEGSVSGIASASFNEFLPAFSVLFMAGSVLPVKGSMPLTASVSGAFASFNFGLFNLALGELIRRYMSLSQLLLNAGFIVLMVGITVIRLSRLPENLTTRQG